MAENEAIVQMLVAKGSYLNGRNDNFETPLSVAVAQRNVNIVSILTNSFFVCISTFYSQILKSTYCAILPTSLTPQTTTLHNTYYTNIVHATE
jgi:ankyrin repeat protein